MATKRRVTLVLGGTGKTPGAPWAGPPPRDFADYARATAAAGVWNP